MRLILYFLLISTFYKFIFLLIDIFVFIKYKNKLKKNYIKRKLNIKKKYQMIKQLMHA